MTPDSPTFTVEDHAPWYTKNHVRAILGILLLGLGAGSVSGYTMYQNSPAILLPKTIQTMEELDTYSFDGTLTIETELEEVPAGLEGTEELFSIPETLTLGIQSGVDLRNPDEIQTSTTIISGPGTTQIRTRDTAAYIQFSDVLPPEIAPYFSRLNNQWVFIDSTVTEEYLPETVETQAVLSQLQDLTQQLQTANLSQYFQPETDYPISNLLETETLQVTELGWEQLNDSRARTIELTYNPEALSEFADITLPEDISESEHRAIVDLLDQLESFQIKLFIQDNIVRKAESTSQTRVSNSADGDLITTTWNTTISPTLGNLDLSRPTDTMTFEEAFAIALEGFLALMFGANPEDIDQLGF